MIKYFSQADYTSTKNTIIGEINISDYVENLLIKDAWINIGGWQSWNPGFEIAPNTKQPSLHCYFIKGWNTYLEFPGTKNKISKNIVLSQFVTYLRWDNKYLFLVSCGNIHNVLPPVQYVINRQTNKIQIELADIGKKWEKDELTAEVEIFSADSYFDARNKLRKIFGSSDINASDFSERFTSIQFLGNKFYGWESWYNHYEKINEKLILEDLNSLSESENFIKISKEKSSEIKNIVFQIDDGWQEQLGTWEINKKNFPNGLKTVTEKIESNGYVPGLWIAPFIVDLRSKSALEHPEWLLRDKKGHLVPAGFNPRWGSLGTFYSLDLSNDEVIQYLDDLIDKAINQWGFRYLKLDFLYAGMHIGKNKNGNSAYFWFNKAITMLTKRKFNNEGKPVAYLGCGMPFELTFNHFPLSRIGCDTYEHWINKTPRLLNWNGRNEAYLNLKDTLGHAIWDKIIFANDPDVIFIRNENCSLTKEEKITIATVAALFGSQIMYSDDPSKSNSVEEINLAKEISEIIEKYKNESFSIKNIDEDLYEIESESKKYKGKINLGEQHYIEINEM